MPRRRGGRVRPRGSAALQEWPFRQSADAQPLGFGHASCTGAEPRPRARILLESEGMSQDLPRWWPVVAGLTALLGLLVSVPIPG